MVATVNSTGTSTGVVITPDSSGVLALQTAGTTAITIDASQNVGIGTASPTNKLSVSTSTGSDGAYITNSDAGGTFLYINNSSASGKKYSWISTGAGNGVGAGTLSAYDHTSGAYRMVIDSSGRVSINGSAIDSSWLSITGNVSNPTLQSYQNTTSLVSHIWFRNTNGVVGSVTTSGSSTAYNTSSDYRLKENIVPMTGALARVAQLKPVTYKWKVDGSDGEGFIAHELAEICPHAVNGEKDAVDAEGNPQYQGIDVSFLVATLTAALQETKALIDTQAETINALTARIVALEQR